MSNVIVINPFEVPEGMEQEALTSWDTFAEYFSKQPGYVSTKLHQSRCPFPTGQSGRMGICRGFPGSSEQSGATNHHVRHRK